LSRIPQLVGGRDTVQNKGLNTAFRKQKVCSSGAERRRSQTTGTLKNGRQNRKKGMLFIHCGPPHVFEIEEERLLHIQSKGASISGCLAATNSPGLTRARCTFSVSRGSSGWRKTMRPLRGLERRKTKGHHGRSNHQSGNCKVGPTEDQGAKKSNKSKEVEPKRKGRQRQGSLEDCPGAAGLKPSLSAAPTRTSKCLKSRIPKGCRRLTRGQQEHCQAQTPRSGARVVELGFEG